MTPAGVAKDYRLPFAGGKNKTSTREVIYIEKVGSAYGIRTRGLVLERDAS
jgi:hypothetical protein